MDCFNRGIEMSEGVIDYSDAMLADIGKWAFANIETHAGFWHSEVKRAHACRLNPAFSGLDYLEAVAELRKAQKAYIRICNLGHLEGY